MKEMGWYSFEKEEMRVSRFAERAFKREGGVSGSASTWELPKGDR